jgi:hypothetical protein
MGMLLVGCEADTVVPAKADPAHDRVGAGRSILVIPEYFQGRYESDPKHCRIALAKRDDDDLESQGGNILLVKPGELHFVQAEWPVQKIEYRGIDSIDVTLLNDQDMDGKKIESKQIRLSLDKDKTLRFEDSSTQYFRCPEAV